MSLPSLHEIADRLAHERQAGNMEGVMNITAARSTSTVSTTENARPFRGRRMSWEEFRKIMKEAANDNRQGGTAMAGDAEQRTSSAQQRR